MIISFELQSHFDMARHWKEEKDWERIKKGVEVVFQDRYKDRKSKLKARLFPRNTNPESLRDTPQRGMAMDDWHKYIDFVSSEKFKNRSEKNKANREKLPYSSNHGTKSYAASRYEKVSICSSCLFYLLKQVSHSFSVFFWLK